jgi:hypothetical protein
MDYMKIVAICLVVFAVIGVCLAALRPVAQRQCHHAKAISSTIQTAIPIAPNQPISSGDMSNTPGILVANCG